MKYKVKPEYGAKIREERVVIGHFGELAIIKKAATGQLLYISDADHILAVGEYVQDTLLRPISSLPAKMSEEITAFVLGGEEDGRIIVEE